MNQRQPRSFNTIKYSNREARKQKRELARLSVLGACVTFVLILLALAVFLFCSLADELNGNTPSKTPGTNEQNPPSSTETVKLTQDNGKISEGVLVLVNEDHYYNPASAPDLVTIEGTQGTPKTYEVLDATWKYNRTALQAFNSMMSAYYQMSGSASIKVTSAYRTAQDQEGKSTPVGYSDHHTGYCLALRNVLGSYLEGTHYVYTDGHRYGFIQRYPAGKENVTGVSEYTYCIRYVGVPHATYIFQNGICLEEYVELLQKNYVGGNHLKIQGADGNSYEVFYVAKSSGDLTTIEIPKGYAYTVSGDNVGGFIVTVNLSQPTA